MTSRPQIRRDHRRRRRRRACARRCSSPKPGSRSRCCRRCSRRARTPWRRRAASARRSATCPRTTGSGTCTTPSRGRTGSGDQDAIEYMCRMAPQVVYELEHFGMPFDRNPDGTIYQRPFGGHSANFGEKPVQRACAAADRTGHAMLHTLYQRNVRAHTQFFVEWMALDLVRNADGDVRGRGRLRDGDRRRDDPAGEGHGARHRRRRPHLRRVDQRVHQHRRRPRHGGARGHPARGHGVLAVPSHGRGRRRRADHRRRARRGRHPAQRERRALHGALRAEPEGPGVARRRVALDGPGDQGRPRHRAREGPRAAEARSPRARRDHEAPAVDPRDRAQVRERRSDQGADPGRADHPLPDGRRADQHPRAGGRAAGTAIRTPIIHGLVRGRRMRVRVGARRQSARHQFAARPARVRPRGRQSHRRRRTSRAQSHRDLPRDAGDLSRARLARLDGATSGESVPQVAHAIRKSMQAHCGVFRNQELLSEGVRQIMELEGRVRAARRSRTRAACSTRRASRRSSSTT